MILLNGNFLAASFIGVMCACGACVDILGDKKESRFPHLPEFIRWEIRITVVALAVRMANLYSMANTAPIRLGEVNAWALASAACLMITIISLTAWALSLRLPLRAWERLRFARVSMKKDPTAVPVMVTMCEVTQISRALGQPTAGPMDAPDVIEREGPRMARMREHARRG